MNMLKKIWQGVSGWLSKQLTFTKLVVLWILYKSIGWIDQSYALAWAGKEEIAETLSNTVVVELLGVTLLYCLKSVFENLSKNNQWPDKGTKSIAENENSEKGTGGGI